VCALLSQKPAALGDKPPGNHQAPTPEAPLKAPGQSSEAPLKAPYQSEGKPYVQETILGDSPPPEPSNGAGGSDGITLRERRRLPKIAIAGAILAVLLGAALTVHLHYDVFVPGEAPDAGSLIRINGPVQRRSGSIHLTTVGVYYGVRLPQLIAAWFDSTAQVVSEAAYPNVPGQEVLAMDQSQRNATLAAFGELGKTNLPSNGALIATIQPNTPAAQPRYLQPGDVITSADGQAITTPDQLGPIVQTHQAGQPVKLQVVRATGAAACPNPTKTLSLEVPVVQNPQNPATRMIGVSVEPHFVLPVDVCINAGNIEGPSAGLSWALEIVNQLGQTDLTRGRVIADTGTMDDKGTVGEIGGVAQKVIGAERQGATLFLVPNAQVAEAKAVAAGRHSKMKVVGVSTLHDAVQALTAP
jgi:Lon-like protease